MKFGYQSLCLIFATWAAMGPLTACGSSEAGPTGTLIFTANGEDFVRQGFVSEDGWSIQFTEVYVNVYGPTAWQTVLDDRQLTLYHGGHPHGSATDGTAHVALTGEYFLSLTQPTFEVGRVENAPIGNYNQLNFSIQPATENAQGLIGDYQGSSVILRGQAQQAEETVDFTIRFNQTIHWEHCGPNLDAGVLAENQQAESQMTFHFDHIFGDAQEGPADPRDQNTVNYVAIGFAPFAELAHEGKVQLDQEAMRSNLEPSVYAQLQNAIRTLGHSGEGHCHVVE